MSKTSNKIRPWACGKIWSNIHFPLRTRFIPFILKNLEFFIEELLSGRIRFRLYRCKSSMKRSQFRGECHLRTAEIDSRQGSFLTTHLLRFKIYAKVQNGNLPKIETLTEVTSVSFSKILKR